MIASFGTRWLGRPLVCLAETESTNDEAARLGREGAPHGTVVTAETQTRGRGRQGRVWYSPPGENLCFSALLRPRLPPAAAPPLTLAAGVAVAEAVNSLGVPASLKWPNDVVVEGRKLAGILTEMSTRGTRIEYVVLGVGINVNSAVFPPDLAAIATSLRRERGGDPLERGTVLRAALSALEPWIERFVAEGAAPIARAWKQRARLLGRHVRVLADGQPLSGVARDVDDEGALLLEADDGRRYRVISGEIAAEETSR